MVQMEVRALSHGDYNVVLELLKENSFFNSSCDLSPLPPPLFLFSSSSCMGLKIINLCGAEEISFKTSIPAAVVHDLTKCVWDHNRSDIVDSSSEYFMRI